jgi:LemA protein
MGIGTIIVLGVLAAIVAYAIMLYNNLVQVKHNVTKAWANIDVLLKQRHDELPKLVKTCEGYMQHERAVFDRLSEARGALMKARSIEQRGEAESMLTRALGGFFAVAESYPDLKANLSFLQLQSRISEIENQIADRREYYNDTVTTFNTRIEQVPDTFVARWLALSPAELFKVEDADREDIEIKFAMAS